MKTLFTLCLFVCFAFVSNAQPICGFDKIHEKLLQQNPSYAATIKANNEQIKKYIAAHPINNTTQRTAVTYTIPVVIHIVHTGGIIGSTYNPTDAQVTGAINYLNQVFNGTYAGLSGGVGDMGLQFALAQRDPNCNATTGINHVDGSSIPGYTANGVNFQTSLGVSDLTVKNFIRWNPADYYNIWIVNKIDGADGTSGQFFAGFAYFPGSPSSLDGTVMLATQMVAGQKTLPHEIGHAFNLYHTFNGSSGNSVCPANTGDCTVDGDMVCDTDPEVYNINGSGVIDFSCRTGTNSCSGVAYSINTESNFMNYTNCYTLFTAGQKARVQASTALSSRSSLIASLGATPTYSGATTCTPKINFEVSSAVQTETTTTTTGCRKYTDYTYYMTIGNNPTASATATLAIASGTATEGVDFDITTNGSFASPSKVLIFPAAAHTKIPFTVRIYDDPIIESTESFTLNYTVNAGAGNAAAGTGNTTMTVSIVDNGDSAPVVAGTPATTSIGTAAIYLTAAPFDATQQQQKSQYIYSASELTAAGISAGNITAIQLAIQTKFSTRAFTGFTIKMVNTTNTSLYTAGGGATLLTGLTTVYTAASYTTTGNSWNNFTFSTPFAWDGVSNVGMEICFQNAAADGANGADQLLCYSDAGSAGKGTIVLQNGINCSQSFTSFNYFSAYKPIIKITYGLTGNAVASTAVTSTSEYLGANADIYFYDGTGKTLARVQNLSSFDYGCTQVTIDRVGSTSSQFWNSNTANYLTSKSFKITPTNNTSTGNFQVTLYYSSAEVTGWQTATSQLFSAAKLVKVANGFFIPDVTPAAQHLADISYATGSVGSFGTSSTISGTFNSSSLSAGFAVGIPNLTTTWTGTTSNVWTLAGNWNNGVPDGTYNVIIPNVVTPPAIAATQSVRDLTVNASASISIANTFNLQVGGNLTHNGSITGLGTLALNGGNTQALTGIGTINNLTINNTSGATITSGGGNAQSITGTLTLTAGAFATNGLLTLKSNAVTTARIAAITGGSINGDITVERYIPAKRAFRFLASPVTTTSTINNNWQEAGSNTAGFGTHITGLSGASNGFDATTTNNASLFTFNAGLQAWAAVTNTNVNTLTAGTGYRLLVRGDRTINLALASPTATSTVLRSKGTIVSGATSSNGLSTAINGFSLVGNPYPSPIDWESVTKSNIYTVYYVWDATLTGTNGRGAYVAYNGTTHLNNNPSSLVDKNIQMGQAVFVQTIANGAASLNFSETNKTATNTAVFRTSSTMPSISVQLFVDKPTQNTTSADGATVVFDNNFNSGYGLEDALKLSNLDENISFVNKGNLLSIDGRPKPSVNDTLQIELSQLGSSNYTLRFNTALLNNIASDVTAYVLDKQTKTKTALVNDGQLDMPFSTSAVVTDKSRFVLMFEQNKLAPIVSNTQLQLYPNPASDQVQVLFSNQIELNTTISITDNLGAKISSYNLGKVKTVNEILNLKSLSKGVYYITLNNGNELKTAKLVVQ